MLRQTPTEQGHEKLGANKLGVATQGIPVATRTRLQNTNYVVALSKYVPTQFKSKPKERVATEFKKIQQRQRQRLKAMWRHKFFMLRQRDQFRLEFWGSTMQLMK